MLQPKVRQPNAQPELAATLLPKWDRPGYGSGAECAENAVGKTFQTNLLNFAVDAADRAQRGASTGHAKQTKTDNLGTNTFGITR